MRLLLTFTLVIFLSVFMVNHVNAYEKEFENSISLGYVKSTKKYIDVDGEENPFFSSAWGGIRIMKRASYPFMVGLGINGAVLNDVYNIDVNLPIAIRLGIYDRYKMDLVTSAGAGYVKNVNFNVSKVTASISGGIEFKRFIDDGMSIGIGAYYTAYTYSKLNNIRVGIVFSF